MALPTGKICKTVEMEIRKNATPHQIFLLFLPKIKVTPAKNMNPKVAILKIPGNRPFGFAGYG